MTAKDYALLLLKYRLRSEKEIYQRLKNKKFTDAVIAGVIVWLKDSGQINDEYFAEAWINSRIKKPLGPRRLRQELLLKGIDRQVIEKKLQRVKADFPEEQVVESIVKEKAWKLKNTDPQKVKRQLYAYLLRRGFSSEVVMEAIKYES